MKWIALTQKNGDQIIYNLDHIVTFWPDADRTIIETIANSCAVVTESINVVLAKIDQIS